MLGTRFAAVFVMVAGAGITLLTLRSRESGDPVARSHDRWVLIRRGTLLYAAGYALDWIWSGTILFFYGAFFLAGAWLFALRTRWIVAVGAVAATAAAGIRWWVYERELGGHDTAWFTRPTSRSPRGLVLDTFVNGSHPLLPWLAFLCAGIALGRLLPLTGRRRAAIGVLAVLVLAISYVLNHFGGGTPLRDLLVSSRPYDRGLVYTVGTVGSSVAAFCLIGWLAERTASARATTWLAITGRSTLTIYVLHILVFNALVDSYGWVRPTGLDTALIFALGFWIAAVAAAVAWQQNCGMAPLERVYRRFGG